jgi:DNA mismatch repair protein MutS2
MSNALKIARRLQLPRELLRRAHHYLRRRQKRAPEMAQLQQLREETEKARAEAMEAQREAQRQAEELRLRAEAVEREAKETAALREARARLQPRDRVYVPKFGETGQIVRIDHKKNIAVVTLGLGKWELSLDEVFPVNDVS